MIIVHRDRSPSLTLDDYLHGTTADIEETGESPDSSVHGKDLVPAPVGLPRPFAPPSIAGPARGRQMDKVWGAELPPVPVMEQASEIDETDKWVPPNTKLAPILIRDRNTPDNWVARDPGLVRLTGKHPFNCEAKLDRLFDAVRH
jgi:nitrate reductase (NAD(P)H)